MKPGKIPEAIRNRSVLKQLKKYRTNHQEGCPDNGIMIAEASRYGKQKDLGAYALLAAVNDLWARGVVPESVSVRFQMPEFACESRVKTMTEAVLLAVEEAAVRVEDIQAETVPVVNSCLAHVTAVGKKTPWGMSAGAARRAEGLELVLTKWAGMEGTLRILEERREELARRFVPAFLAQTDSLRAFLFSRKEAEMAASFGALAMHQVTEEGIFGALWRLAEEFQAGLQVSLKDIPVRQETIEICEYYHINPYEMTSAGCMLIAAPEGEELVKVLKEVQVPAAVIGKLTDGNDRIILRGEEVSYLDRPQPEALAGCFQRWIREEQSL